MNGRLEVLTADVAPVHSFNVEGISPQLIGLDRWVLWVWKKIGGKWSKIPKQSRFPLQNASSTDSETWTDFSSAVEAAEKNDLGIGFVFNGDGIVGIDLDDCREAETGKLAGWAEDIIGKLKTYTEVSPSGTGLKLFVRGELPEGCRSGFKRPEGGSVEVYSTGRFFTVTGQREPGTPDEVREQQGPLTAVLAMFTRWVEDAKPKQQASVKRNIEQPITQDRERQIKRASAYLSTIPGAVSGQGGSTATFITTKKVLSFGLSREDAFDVLSGWNFKCVPPWNDEELWHKIDNAIKSGLTPIADREQYPVSDQPIVDPFETEGESVSVSPEAESATKVSKPLPIKTAGELIQQYPSLRPPILEGLLRRGETMNIVAAPKTGKSWLSMGLGLAVTVGFKWLGQCWATPGRVLIVDNELHCETSAHRLPQVAEAMGISLDQYADRLCVMNLRGGLIDLKELSLQLSSLNKGDFDLIVLDAWYRFQPIGSDENSNSDVAALYNTLDALASRIDCAFVCIHHSSKGSQAGKSVTDTGSGAGSQSRAADTHLVMRQHQHPNAVAVEAAVRSFKPMKPFCLRWEFPVFILADDLDPSDLKQDNPRHGRKQTEEPVATTVDQRQQEEHEKRKKLMDAYMAFPEGETMRVIREATTMNTNTFKAVNSELIRAGIVSPCKVLKNKRYENGFKADQQAFFLRWDSMGQLLEIPPCPTSPTDTAAVGGTAAPPLGAASRPTDRRGGDGTDVRVLSDQEVNRIGDRFTVQSV